MNDWIQETVNAIADIAFPFDPQGGKQAFNDNLNAIILEHAPFHMRVPRCDMCKHWKPLTFLRFNPETMTKETRVAEDHGECLYADAVGAKISADAPGGAGILTERDFGCVQWEAK